MKGPQLTDTQNEIVNSMDPTLIAYGSAGTGKTTAALYAARAEIEHRAAPHQRVLFLTFSRTAVAQILDRAGPVLDSLDDRVEIMTFHGFAYRMIMDFGQYAGFGPTPPPLIGEAEARMRANDGPALRFNDLLPGCLRVLTNDFVRSLLTERWPMIICDEFQDTGDDHWQLIECLAPPARLLLLADPHQLIYDGFVAGVGAHRLSAALARPEARIVQLQPASHRDPSQILPTAAAKIRERQFEVPEVSTAINQNRLTVLSGVSFDASGQVVADTIAIRKGHGDASFGIYVHGNGPAAELSANLTSCGVANVAVGFPEAFGQSLQVMVESLSYIYGLRTWDAVEFRLGVLAASLSRSKEPPRLARMLCGNEPRPAAVEARLAELAADCDACDEPVAALQLAAEIWPRLGITTGNQQWARAAEVFKATAASHPSRTGNSWIDDTRAGLEQNGANSLVGINEDARGPVQVMNLHQTKGREADATILVFRDGEYFGRDSEPYESSSRLLYVALTRARSHVTIILGEQPHPLIAPLRHYSSEQPTT